VELPVRFAAPDLQRQGRGRVSPDRPEPLRTADDGQPALPKKRLKALPAEAGRLCCAESRLKRVAHALLRAASTLVSMPWNPG
jgi:hypothetical protein